MSVETSKTFEELHYPTLFEWEYMNSSENKYLFDCAKYLCRTIIRINEASRSYSLIKSENQAYEVQIAKLLDKCEKLENCQNCISLQKQLDGQDAKFKTLADIFNKVTFANLPSNNAINSKTGIERVQDIFTQIVEANNISITQKKDIKTHQDINKIKQSSKRRKSDEGVSKLDGKHEPSFEMSPGFQTPKKRIKIAEIHSSNGGDLQDVEDNCKTSPILPKSKFSRINKTSGWKTPSRILNNSCDSFAVESPKPESKAPERESSPLSLSNIKLEVLSNLEIAKEATGLGNVKSKPRSNEHIKKTLPMPYMKKENDDPLNNVLRPKKSPTVKKLKQSRLSFSNFKEKLPIDVSQTDNFCGGLRGATTEMKSDYDEEDVFRIALELSLNESSKKINTEDEDVIDASPSCQLKKLKKFKRIKKSPLKSKPGPSSSVKCEEVYDDEQTMIFPKEEDLVKSLKVSPNDCSKREKSKLRLSISPKKPTKTEQPINEPQVIVYKEDPVRKKADKKNLPGWSCQKCKDFYEVAFAGNDEVLRTKMELCSKHRGKFNPERPNTPAGFWDLSLPTSQDTETFNRRNNSS